MMDFKFTCQRCLHCCSGEPGYVFLSKRDIECLSSFLGLSEDEFLQIYARKVDYGLYYMFSLKERDNFDCIFLTKDGCSVYEARPVQCSTYPFWEGICDSSSSFLKEGDSCPGIGKGKVWKKEEIDALLEKNKANCAYILWKNKK